MNKKRREFARAPVVKVAKLNKDCEGCMAAQRALEGWRRTCAFAVKKNKEQALRIQRLETFLGSRVADHWDAEGTLFHDAWLVLQEGKGE